MNSYQREDPHTDLPSEIRVVYPLILGTLLVYWITTSWGLGWLVALAIGLLWLRSARREPVAQQQPSMIRAAVLADSPGPWDEWRVRTIAKYGRCLPVLAHFEFGCQWIWFLFTRWRIGPVLVTTAVLFALFTPEAPDPDRDEVRLRLAHATAFSTPSSTAPGSVRRRALADLVAARTDLRHATFSGWNLDDATCLAGYELGDADFEGATMRAAKLAHTNLAAANLVEVDAYGADLAGAELRHVRASDASFAGADLTAVRARHAGLSGADLRGTVLASAELEFAQLQDARLENADLRGANLSHAVLAGARLQGADLRGARCVGCDFSDTDLVDARWVAADLAGARWRTGSLDLEAEVTARLAGRARRVTRDGIDWIEIQR